MTSSDSTCPVTIRIQEDDFDLDAGRHLDDGLVLFGTFDQVFADRVGGIGEALAHAAAQQFAAKGVKLDAGQISGTHNGT